MLVGTLNISKTIWPAWSTCTFVLYLGYTRIKKKKAWCLTEYLVESLKPVSLTANVLRRTEKWQIDQGSEANVYDNVY